MLDVVGMEVAKREEADDASPRMPQYQTITIYTVLTLTDFDRSIPDLTKFLMCQDELGTRYPRSGVDVEGQRVAQYLPLQRT